jgi:imidazolonepropionase
MAGTSGYGIRENATLKIRNGRIAWIGDAGSLTVAETASAHDIGGRWITPGLIDCHTHLIYGGNRSREFEMRLNGATYAEIAAAGGGIRSTVSATRRTGEAELLAAARNRLMTLLEGGVTSVEVKSGYGLDRDTELAMLRVARGLEAFLPGGVFATYLGAHTIPEEFAARPDAYVDFIVGEMLPEIAAGRLADAMDVCFEHIGFDREQAEKLLAAARGRGLAVKLHTGQFAALGGGALAAKYRALSADHLEHLDEADAVAMAAAGTVAVLLPGAFYFLRETKRPPVDLLRRHGVCIAIATDHNPGSSPILSLQLAMNMASVFFSMTPEECLAGVTRNAARALGIAEDRGTIEAGKRADLAIWEIEGPAELSYRIGGLSPWKVVRGGRMVDRPTAPPASQRTDGERTAAVISGERR